MHLRACQNIQLTISATICYARGCREAQSHCFRRLAMRNRYYCASSISCSPSQRPHTCYAGLRLSARHAALLLRMPATPMPFSCSPPHRPYARYATGRAYPPHIAWRRSPACPLHPHLHSAYAAHCALAYPADHASPLHRACYTAHRMPAMPTVHPLHLALPLCLRQVLAEDESCKFPCWLRWG
jgi:hypothetical protein